MHFISKKCMHFLKMHAFFEKCMHFGHFRREMLDAFWMHVHPCACRYACWCQFPTCICMHFCWKYQNLGSMQFCKKCQSHLNSWQPGTGRPQYLIENSSVNIPHYSFLTPCSLLCAPCSIFFNLEHSTPHKTLSVRAWL